MTSERDFDRIARAWLDLGPNEAPDRAVAAVLQAVETTSQVRRPIRWPSWRPTTMTRITMLAVLAGTVAIAIGALVMSGGSRGPAPTTAPASIAPLPAGGAYPSPRPVPDTIRGGWSAASRGTAVEDPDITTIVMGGSALDQYAPEFSIDRPGKVRGMGSNVVETEPGVLRITLSNAGDSGCAMRDAGTYGWSTSADGQWLTLELIDDACPVRAAFLPGTWQRNLGFSSPGGAGIATNFKPYLSLTLPTRAWTGREYAEADTFVADRDDATFKVWKDLDGFRDPCDIEKGRLPLKDLDALLAYFRDDPRFTVTSEEEFMIDGHRAVQIEFRLGRDIKAPCWTFDGNPDDRSGVLLWMPSALPGGFWNGQIDTDGFIVVTEVDGSTLAFEAGSASGDTWTVDRATIDTVRFLDDLPTPPAS
jgi:hypothetical protein